MTNFRATSLTQSAEPMAADTTVAKHAIIRLIRGYQAARAGRVSPCRFYPSCSTYAIEAVEVHGVVRGLALAARRIIRCRPFGPHGVDLVPVAKKAR